MDGGTAWTNDECDRTDERTDRVRRTDDPTCDRRSDGWTDGQRDGRMDGRKYKGNRHFTHFLQDGGIISNA